MTDTHPSATRRGVLLLLVGSFLISFSAVFVKIAHVGPTAAGIYRNLFGAGALLLYVIWRRETLWRGVAPFLWAALAGLLFAADLFFWHRSIEYIGPGLSTIMGNFQVFFLAGAGILFLKEKVTWRFLVAIPLAILGLFLLVGVDWSNLGESHKIGVLFGLITALTYAAYLLILRYSQTAKVRLMPAANLMIITLVTAAFLLISARVEEVSLAIPDAQSWVVLIAYGVVCQAAGWIIITNGLTRVDASRAGLLLLLQPTLTFVWDVLLFARPTTGIEVLGALLALGAIYLGNTRRART